MNKLMVIIPSYNKGKYIKEAIESVLMQKTKFDFKIIIADDGSTDDSKSIITEYTSSYPDKFIFINSDLNKGLLANIIEAYKKLDCEYFCCLDADDILTDENFYQKAVSFLEKNLSFNIYCANTYLYYPNGKRILQNNKLDVNYVDYTFSDLLNQKAILGNTISSVFRNNVISNNTIQELSRHIGTPYEEHSYREDDFRNRIHLEKGKAHYVNAPVGAYRITDTGIYQGCNLLKKHLLKITSYLDSYEYFSKKYPQFIEMIALNLYKLKKDAFNYDITNITKYPAHDIEQFLVIIKRIFEIAPNVLKSIFDDLYIYNQNNIPEYLKEAVNSFIKITEKNKLNNKTPSIYIYGAGDLCEMLLFELQKLKVKVTGIFDRNPGKRFGFEVVQFNPKQIKVGDIIFVASHFYSKEIVEKLNKELIELKKVCIISM